MNNQEINDGIKEVCKTSLEVATYYTDNNVLIEKLNSVPQNELNQASNYYASRSGDIINLRKEVLNYLKNGKKLDLNILETFVDKHRKGKENQYRSYKNYYTIFFPIITFYGHNTIRAFIEKFIKETISRLDIVGKVKLYESNFQGPRQQGSDRYWFAIYNKQQKSQSAGLQLFVEFFRGEVRYGVYRHSNKTYLKGPVEVLPEDFVFEEMIKLFNDNKNLIIEDDMRPPSAEITKIYSNNIILYGPPGTGKTYKTIDIAAEIVTGNSNENHAKNKEIFDRLKKEGQIEFITFHQNYAYEDFIVGIRPDVEFDQLRFKPYKGIFYEIAKRARENYTASSNEQPKERSFVEVFSEIVKPVIEKGQPVKIKMTSGVYYTITDISEYSIHFSKPNGNSVHTLSIQTLEDIVDGIREFTTGLGPYYNPLAAAIKAKKKDLNNINSEQKKNFVLVIDEINRANISKVFGELITLLEKDKRIGGENELRITLPNGEREFGVPPNLYLVGTMNTADKSIALIDIALRRRFEFLGCFPDYKDLSEGDRELLKHINTEVYRRKKSSDFLIGHAYFMTGDDVNKIIKNKMIPLLMEYFSGKTDVVEDIFKESSWDIKYDFESYEWLIQSES